MKQTELRAMNRIGLELLSEENSLDVYSFEKENQGIFERGTSQTS